MGECYERLNNLDQALHYFEQALQNKDLHADAWLGKAIVLNLKNNQKEAYQCIKKALAIDDKEPDYWYTCGEIEEKLGLIEASLYSIEMSITLDHENVNLMIYYVQLIYRNMDIISSFEVVNDAIGTFPKESKLLYFKTGLCLCSGHYKEAYNSLERALRINIGNAHFLFDNFPEAKKDQNLLKLISEKQN
jgi:tetratricopeptide (TPR) repeat protein